MSERGPAQNLCPLSSPCGLPQEGALDLLKKLNSCQMSIQLLQVGRGWEASGAVPGDGEVKDGGGGGDLQGGVWEEFLRGGPGAAEVLGSEGGD